MINKLTQEQIDLFPIYVAKYTKLGLSTSSVTDEEICKAVYKLYECGKEKPPKHIVILDSPYAVVDFMKLNCPKNKQQFKWGFGSMDAHWVAFYMYFWKECGIDIPRIEGLYDCLKIGWYLAYKDICIVSHKPTEIHLDNNKVLHNEKGMAVRYADGKGIYVWHGIMLPEKYEFIITDKDKLTTDIIDAENNSELKRILLERFGYDNYIQKVEASVIDHSRWGTLYEIPVVNREPIRIVKVVDGTPAKDGTRRQYFLKVSPKIKTALEAVAWTFNMPINDYQKLVLET